MGKFSEWNSTDEMNYACKYTNDWTNPISGEVEPLEITVTATRQQLKDLPLYGVNAQEMIKRSAISELENYKHHRIVDTVVSYAKECTSFFDALDDCLGFERPEIWCDIKKMEYVIDMLQRLKHVILDMLMMITLALISRNLQLLEYMIDLEIVIRA